MRLIHLSVLLLGTVVYCQAQDRLVTSAPAGGASYSGSSTPGSIMLTIQRGGCENDVYEWNITAYSQLGWVCYYQNRILTGQVDGWPDFGQNAEFADWRLFSYDPAIYLLDTGYSYCSGGYYEAIAYYDNC